MSPSTLLSLILFSAPPSAPLRSPPGVAEAGAGAWAVVHAGQLWVCWREAPDCWRRVELQSDPRNLDHTLDGAELGLELDAFMSAESEASLEVGAQRWRLGFWGPRSLWIELDDRRWRVELGQQRATMVEQAAPVRLSRPRASSCGSRGLTPAIIGGRLAWQSAPRCQVAPPASSCVAPPSPRLRRPLPLRVGVGVQLTASHGWTARSDDTDQAVAISSFATVLSGAGVELSVVAELGFDVGRTRADERARSAILRRSRRRSLPAPVSGPLAAREQRALVAGVCGTEGSP